MEARVIRALVLLALLGLAACGDSETYGAGPLLNTESAEDKEDESWFKSFYGTEKSEDAKEHDWWGKYYGSGKSQ